MTGAMRRRSATIVLAAATLAAVLCVPALAWAKASVPATVPAPASKTATAGALGQWALDFTLPTFGKSGCLVCHSDPKLVVPKGGQDISYWIDEAAYDRSVHARVVCTGCHTDFGFKAPHTSTVDWKMTAKQSCVSCHDKEARDFSDGAHALKPGPDRKQDPKADKKPRCGDCHGSHDMAKLKDNPAGKAALHSTGEAMCGGDGCHKDYWDNYNDYYHGRAYKRGAEDAPACWDCHGAHTVLPSKSALSPTNEANLPATCAKGARGDLTCHEGMTEQVMGYVELVHKKDEVLSSNPFYKLWRTVGSWFK